MGDKTGDCSHPDLPDELVIDILSHLPVKSLLRFACVCKSWLRLIKSDPQFAIKHYITRATSSSTLLDNTDYILNLDWSRNMCRYSLTETKTIWFLNQFVLHTSTTYQPPLPLVITVSLVVGNSCHGMICFYECRHHTIILCNPSIREVVVPPGSPFQSLGYLAFGFDPIRNDYKIASFFYPSQPRGFWPVQVYSVRRGHWRTLSFKLDVGYVSILGNSVALNGNGRMCNWLINHSHNKQDLLCFDMGEEVLKVLPLPECLNPKKYKELLSSTRWRACLSCLPYIHRIWIPHDTVDIWVLHEGDGDTNTMWSKQLSVRFPEQEVICPPVFWINEKELLVGVQMGRDQDQVFHYDVGSQQFSPTQRIGFHRRWPHGYVESLVSIKGMMSSIHGEEQDAEDKDSLGHHLAQVQMEVAGESHWAFAEVGTNGTHWFCYFKLFWLKTGS